MRRPRAGESADLAAPLQPGHLDLPAGAPVLAEFVAVLWVPDPEQRHWWREYYIRHAPHSKPNTRPIGFGRPR